MKLNYEGIKDTTAWQAAGIALPSYDVEASSRKAVESPVWVHMGAGNIFRIFLGTIAEKLLSDGSMDRGITCVETYDTDIIDKIYIPHDNLVLAVTMHNDGNREKKVLGSISESIKIEGGDNKGLERLGEVFASPSLQLVSFTITEKGYALKNADGEYFSFVRKDIENGPEAPVGIIGIVTAMLYKRYQAGHLPLALVSMDNVSQNGRKLQESVCDIANKWTQRGFTDPSFLKWLTDGNEVTFPWTMIDKITPRPLENVAEELARLGVEDMEAVITDKHTYISPFANAEEAQYLVIEDSFPNGRPQLEKAGVYMADRETVRRAERMKVTVCLNPIHTALCTYACMFGYELFSDAMRDEDLLKLAKIVGYTEGLPVVEDPGILSPKEFLDEVINERFTNPYLGDTSARIAVDISQMVGIRFGETVKAYVKKDGSAAALKGIPLAIAGWIRYLLAVDDNGDTFELSPDPMAEDMKTALSGVEFENPESLQGKLRPILSNANIFGSDLYEAGIGDRIEEIVRYQISAPGAVRRSLQKYL